MPQRNAQIRHLFCRVGLGSLGGLLKKNGNVVLSSLLVARGFFQLFTSRVHCRAHQAAPGLLLFFYMSKLKILNCVLAINGQHHHVLLFIGQLRIVAKCETSLLFSA